MSLTIGDNFSFLGSKPLDGRIKYDTVAAMKAMSESSLYEGCIAYCTATDKNYQWKSTNTVDSTLGKWRELETGGGATVLTGTLSSSSWNNYSQTATVQGMTSNTNGIVGLLDTATAAQTEAAAAAKIRPTAQGTNSITFACDTAPAVNIPFGVIVFD